MIVIRDARVLTVTNGTLEKSTVVIKDGKIAAVGVDDQIPADATIIDGHGKWLTPGFIESHGHPNLSEEPAFSGAPSDVHEISQPITAHLRIIDSIDPAHKAFTAMRRGGFTTVCALPGSANLIGGMGICLKNHKSDIIDDLVIQDSEHMKMALGENPRAVYGGQKKMPSTRMGSAALLRETLHDAKKYSDKMLIAERDGDKGPESNFKMEALVPVVRREMRCRIHAHRADDIVTAIRIAKEFNLDFFIEHTSDGRRIAKYLADNNVKCVVGPLNVGPIKQEAWNISKETPAVLDDAGVEFSLSHDSGTKTVELPIVIGTCIAHHGLRFNTALKAVTIQAAKIIGLDQRLGSIEVGKDADLALWSGDPFNNYSKCELTIIDGVIYKD